MATDWQGDLHGVRERNKELLTNCWWSDVSLVVYTGASEPRKLIKAHKLILASASTVFENWFFGDSAPHTDRVVTITDFAPETISTMLKYIYADVVALDSWPDAVHLFKAAKHFKLRALAQHCVVYISKRLAPENALYIYEFATCENVPSLGEAALRIIRYKTRDALAVPYFANIAMCTLSAIADQDVLETSEVEFFDKVVSLAALRQTTGAPGDDATPQAAAQWQQFREVVKQIRFLSIADTVFKDGAAFSPFLTVHEALAISVCITNPHKIGSHYPREFTQRRRQQAHLPRFFFDMVASDAPIGRIVTELRCDVVPRAVENFRALCAAGESRVGFRGSKFCKIFPHVYMGYARQLETGHRVNESPCERENFVLRHTGPGVVGMMPCVNPQSADRSGFYITFVETPECNNKSVAIGRVVEGMDVLQKLKSFSTTCGAPSGEVIIYNCGELLSE